VECAPPTEEKSSRSESSQIGEASSLIWGGPSTNRIGANNT